jgi:hypothetical protein
MFAQPHFLSSQQQRAVLMLKAPDSNVFALSTSCAMAAITATDAARIRV